MKEEKEEEEEVVGKLKEKRGERVSDGAVQKEWQESEDWQQEIKKKRGREL